MSNANRCASVFAFFLLFFIFEYQCLIFSPHFYFLLSPLFSSSVTETIKKISAKTQNHSNASCPSRSSITSSHPQFPRHITIQLSFFLYRWICVVCPHPGCLTVQRKICDKTFHLLSSYDVAWTLCLVSFEIFDERYFFLSLIRP